MVLETVKKAEEDDSVIVRLHDEYNQKTECTLTPGFAFREVYLCDLMENQIAQLSAENGAVKVPVKNYEIVTVKFVR